MAKRLTIEIRPLEDALSEFAEAFKTAATGRRVRRRDGIYFTSIEAARNLLTPNRLALLSAIRTKRPSSIYELARLVRRDLKNVQSDLQLLQRYGVVRMARGHGTGKRKIRTPTTPFSEIALKIAI
jgi:predicted transcriptional regulator